MPMMISRETMKKMRITMDLEEDMVIIGEGKVKLRVSKSGKYLLPLERNVREHANTDAKGRRKI